MDPDADHGVPNVSARRRRALPGDHDEIIREAAIDDEHYRLITADRDALAPSSLRSSHGTDHRRAHASCPGPRGAASTSATSRWPGARPPLAAAIDNARLYAERAYIASTLQQSLLPAELPEIPGLETAARFRPTGEGNDVGGDFYDLFAAGGRGWSVVMGDVCGKGPDAAAVTALARYTLRAAAMRDRLPSAA